MQASTASREIIDFQGASGASYRFRRIDRPSNLPVSGGNFICVKRGGAAVSVVCAGTASDLSHARETCVSALSEHGATEIYIRLNVTGSVREAEHVDVTTRHEPIWKVG